MQRRSFLARALFSDQLLQNLLDNPQSAGRTAREAHHLFPTNWLRSHGILDRRRVNQVANLAEVGWHENTAIGGQSPSVYVPRLREELGIDENRWGRMCAEHALPFGWERMDYEEFIRRVGLGWQNLSASHSGSSAVKQMPRRLHRRGSCPTQKRSGSASPIQSAVYASTFGATAAATLQAKLPERDRESLMRALRARPPGSDPLTVVDYLYLGQLPPLLFANDVWQEVRSKLRDEADAKQRLQGAVGQIAPVRNEIAHVREVASDRLMKATVACDDILALLGGRSR